MQSRRILNLADRVNAGVNFQPVERETHRFAVGGKEFDYDVHAMTLRQAGGTAADDPASRFRPDFPHPGAKPFVDYLVLYLTRRCNLRCRYCFVPNGSDEARATMTSDTARRALELLLPPRRPVTVAFFGGEPLLAWELLAEVVELTKRLHQGPGAPRFHLTTNGTLLDAPKAAFLDREGFDLIVSLDGPRDIHDRHRRAADGSGSYEAALKGLRLLRGTRLAGRTTLRATFPADELRLAERLDHHHRLLDEGLCRGITIEPASLLEGAGSFDSPGMDWDAVEREYGEAARFLRDRVRGRRRAAFESLVRFVRRLAYREPACDTCHAGNGYASVAPDGTIHACHREGENVIGHLAAGGLDEARRAAWLDNRFYLCAKCMACPIRLVCGGPCRQDGLERGGLHTPAEAGCRLRHIAFRWAAWLLSELSRREIASLTGRRGSSCCGPRS